MMKERIPYIDLGAGIMILWVLLFHALGKHFALELQGLQNVAGDSSLPDGTHAYIDANGIIRALDARAFFPYLHFFMPWFFYKSGQFFKKRDAKELIEKDTRKLLYPFII